jgi:argininosuccinate lyase
VTAAGTGSGGAAAGGAGRLWGGRFSADPDAAAWALGVSTSFDRHLWAQDIAGSRAHARELARVGVLADEERDMLLVALDRCAELFAADAFAFEPSDEDVHGAIERWLLEELGPVGGKLRAGRSRNDQIANDLRLWCREACDALVGSSGGSSRPWSTRPRHTSTGWRPATPTSSVASRSCSATTCWPTSGCSTVTPPGCAGRGRAATCRSSAPGRWPGRPSAWTPPATPRTSGTRSWRENSIDAVASRDFALELLSACAVLAVNLSRLAEEIVLWATDEFGVARVGDAFSTGSSIMPQKRNPDVAELVRGKTGRVVGDLVSLLTTVKALPLAYDRDLQEDKEPVFDAVGTLTVVLPAMTGMVASLRFDRGRLAAASAGGFALATDLAEELVRRGVAFREAHEVVGRWSAPPRSGASTSTGSDPGSWPPPTPRWTDPSPRCSTHARPWSAATPPSAPRPRRCASSSTGPAQRPTPTPTPGADRPTGAGRTRAPRLGSSSPGG